MANSTADLIGVVKSQKAAAEALGISPDKLRRLSRQSGFPTHADGYDIDAIVTWLEADASTAAEDGQDCLSDTEGDASPKMVTITITLPVSDPRGYIAQETLQSIRPHIDCRMRSEDERVGLRHVHQGLVDSHAQFADGKHVDSMADAVRWVCEQAGIQIREQQAAAA